MHLMVGTAQSLADSQSVMPLLLVVAVFVLVGFFFVIILKFGITHIDLVLMDRIWSVSCCTWWKYSV